LRFDTRLRNSLTKQRFSGFWYNALKVIFFKKIYEQIDKNGELHTIEEYTEKNNKIIRNFLEKNTQERLEFIKQNNEQYENLIKQITNNNQQYSQDKEKTLQIIKQISDQSNQKNENLIKQIIKQNNQEGKNFIKENLLQNEELIKQIIDENNQQITELTKHNVGFTSQNQLQNKELLKHNADQNIKQYKEFIEWFSEKATQKNDEHAEKITSGISEVSKLFLEDNNKQYENFIKENKIQIIEYIKQNKIEKLEYIKQNSQNNNVIVQQNLKYIQQNKIQLTEFINETYEQNKHEIKQFIEQISQIVTQNKEQIQNEQTEMFKQNRKQNILISKDFSKNFSNILDEQNTKFMKQFSRQNKQENYELLEQISEQNEKQLSGFIDKISEENNKQNSVFIKQNTELISQILSQTRKNHGTINKKFEELVNYQTLSEFRENLITIKTNMIILQKLDDTQLKIYHNLHMKYHKIHSEIPVLDVTQGILIIKILFPSFFTEMLANLSILKNQFEDDVYTEMTYTIKKCDYFFKNFIREPEKLDEVKGMLESDIIIVENLLTKLTSIN